MNDTNAGEAAPALETVSDSVKRTRGPSTNELVKNLLLGSLDLESITKDQAKRLYKALPEDRRAEYGALCDIVGVVGERGRSAFGPGMTRTFRVQNLKGKKFIRLPLDFLADDVKKVVAAAAADGSGVSVEPTA